MYDAMVRYANSCQTKGCYNTQVVVCSQLQLQWSSVAQWLARGLVIRLSRVRFPTTTQVVTALEKQLIHTFLSPPTLVVVVVGLVVVAAAAAGGGRGRGQRRE
ncbi:hypothetical protein ElyMa_000037900 [Elysia marginata]|uniref:Uncharacterized protein n=1 Tax=Elysia marginata TaxID=1093978 RepID=A0AAV4EDF3_9GAST|nr:hypothetical protein ElyMa_000037900 [Elysia marginata]